MIQSVNFNTFADRFLQSDTYKNNFTYNGLKALFDHLEQYEEDTGEQLEFDMVALCCEYSEYKTAIEVATNYFDFCLSDYDNISVEDAEKEALEYLKNNTTVIEFED